jgi:hypothetical protein
MAPIPPECWSTSDIAGFVLYGISVLVFFHIVSKEKESSNKADTGLEQNDRVRPTNTNEASQAESGLRGADREVPKRKDTNSKTKEGSKDDDRRLRLPNWAKHDIFLRGIGWWDASSLPCCGCLCWRADRSTGCRRRGCHCDHRGCARPQGRCHGAFRHRLYALQQHRVMLRYILLLLSLVRGWRRGLGGRRGGSGSYEVPGARQQIRRRTARLRRRGVAADVSGNYHSWGLLSTSSPNLERRRRAVCMRVGKPIWAVMWKWLAMIEGTYCRRVGARR